MNKRILHGIGKVLEVVLYLVLVLTIFVILSPRLPTKGQFQTYVVPTGSMVPVIYPGAVAVVKPTADIQIGDIIAFENPNDQYQLVLHRAVEQTNLGWITKGDANQTSDNWKVQTTNIKGKLLFSIPLVGHIVAFARTKLGFAVMVLFPSSILMFLNFRDIYLGIKEEHHKRKYKNIVVSIVAATILLASFSSLKVNSVLAQFSTTAVLSGISISAAAATPTPTGTPTPSQTPQPTATPVATETPTPTPTPTASPTSTPKPHHDDEKCEDIDVEISDDEDEGERKIEVECEDTHVHVHVKHHKEKRDIHIETEYDEDNEHKHISKDIDDKNEEDSVIQIDLCDRSECQKDKLKNKKTRIFIRKLIEKPSDQNVITSNFIETLIQTEEKPHDVIDSFVIGTIY